MLSFLLRAVLLLALPCGVCVAEPTPSGEVLERSVVVRCGGQELSASLDNATLTLRTPDGEVCLHPNLQLDAGWTAPEPSGAEPVWERAEGDVAVSITYPVKQQRELSLSLSAYDGVEAVFVTSRLRVLDQSRGQYYYWQSDLSADHYFAPGQDGPTRIDYKVAEWDGMPWREWWFVPRAAGGVAILPTTVAGRAPGEAGAAFLHAVPRSNLIDLGSSLDCAFGLASVADAAAAQKVSLAARGAAVPALHPGSLPAPPVDYGRPAPDWLRQAEVYNLYYRNKDLWTEEVVRGKLAGFPFIVGSTPDKVALDRCHARGVRLLHYVVYTCLLDTALQVAEGGALYTEWTESIDNENRDLKDHPDWICIDREGRPQHDGWGREHGHPGLLNTCLHQPGLKQAAVRQVRMLMELGYDGVFIDLSGPTVECHGPKFGKHTHPNPDWTNTEAYEDVLRAIYEAVKSYGEDRVVVQNTCTGILPSHWAYCDSQMLESYPYSSETPTLRQPWPELEWNLRRHAEAVAHGKVPVMLPYFGQGSAEELRDAALLSRAYGALAGFLWADGLGLGEIEAARGFSGELYAARLGGPAGPVQETAGVWWRAFEHGIAVVNPLPWEVTAAIPWDGAAPLRDVGHDRQVAAEGGVVKLRVAGEAGRLLLRR